MNSFTTIVALCVVMAATCSGAYRTQSWGTQPVAVPVPVHHTNLGGYGNKVWGNSNIVATPVATQQTFSAPTPVQEAPVAAAPVQHSFPATTQQICTCVPVLAAASSTSATTAPLDKTQQAAQQTYSAPAVATAPAPAQQTYSAPAPAQQTYSAPAQPTVFRPATQHSGY